MGKHYLWRATLLFLSLFVAVLLYCIPCAQTFGRCVGGDDMPVVRTSFHFLLAIFVVSIFLFFINDNVFKKWFIFTVAWLAFSFTLISITPEYSGGWGPSYNLEKEAASILMAKAFVIISLVLIIWQSIKERKSLS